MPGPHVDKAYDDIVAKLTDDKTPNAYGSEAFDSVEKNTTLTPQEKQEVHQRLGKAAMQHELTKANNHPPQFLRLASSSTNYITAYLKEYAKEYNQAVLEATKKELDGVKIPNDPGLTQRFPVPGAPQDMLSKEKPETLQSLTDSTKDLAGRIVQAHDDNLHKLSPEAQEFLKSTMEPVQAQNNQELTSRAMSSTLMLKNTAPMIGEFAQSMGGNQQKTENLTEQQMKGNVLLQASKVMQTYANNVHKPPGTSLKQSGKAQDVMAEQLLTAENLDRTNNAYSTLSNGGQELTDLNTKLLQKEQTAKTLAAQQELQAKLQPFNAQIKALEDKKAQLQTNPSIGDKFKAFFQHGFKGVQGEIEKLDKKIEATKVAKNDVETGVTMEQRQQDLDRMKHNQASLGAVLQQAEGVVVQARLDESGLTTQSSVSDKQLKEAISEGTNVKELQKELGDRIKTQEKVLSVREKLGPKAPEKSQGQSRGVHI